MGCESKKSLRAKYRKAGGERLESERQRLSDIIADRIERLPRFADAATVALYYPLPDEVSTLPLLRRWNGTKRLALPAIEDGRMVFREYTGEEDLIPGEFGIARPRSGKIVLPREIDIMIVPGMAFDRAGRRLGRGKGFYDRYLGQPEASHIYKVGVCFPWRLAAEIPCEPHDAAMDEVVTPPGA